MPKVLKKLRTMPYLYFYGKKWHTSIRNSSQSVFYWTRFEPATPACDAPDESEYDIQKGQLYLISHKYFTKEFMKRFIFRGVLLILNCLVTVFRDIAWKMIYFYIFLYLQEL